MNCLVVPPEVVNPSTIPVYYPLDPVQGLGIVASFSQIPYKDEYQSWVPDVIRSSILPSLLLLLAMALRFTIYHLSIKTGR